MSTTATSASAIPTQTSTAGRSPLATPTRTGTMADSTPVTGETMLIGATAMAEYISPTPTTPHAPPSRLHSSVDHDTEPGNSGSRPAMSNAPAG